MRRKQSLHNNNVFKDNQQNESFESVVEKPVKKINFKTETQ